MNFTRAQKEALWRKIEEASSVKKKRIITEFEKNWKPSPKSKDLFDKLKKVVDLEKKVEALRDEITGGDYCKVYDLGDAKVHIYKSGKYETVLDTYKSIVMQDFENRLYRDKVIPSETAVMDELELQLLSKTFDVQAFLAKFGVKE